MKFDSPLFDRIRVKPEQGSPAQDRRPGLRMGRLHGNATHRAPKGRGREKDYWRFCLDHVREYNQSYNFFAGMSDADVMAYQKDALTGHRPTWKMGTGKGGPRGRTSIVSATSRSVRPVRRGRAARNSRRGRKPGCPQCRAQGARYARSRYRRHRAEVKTRFKELVKRHHPDANGGDRSTEDRLIEIIQAYNYLKSVGFG